jgi:TonB family protein
LLDSKPRVIESPLPPSLDSLARAVKPGRVVVQFIVDTMGVPELGSVRVLTSPDTALSRAAAAAILLWRFRPGHVRGHAVRVLVEVPVDFTIKRN